MPDDGSAEPHQQIAEVERRTVRVPQKRKGRKAPSQGAWHAASWHARRVPLHPGAVRPSLGAVKGMRKHPGANAPRERAMPRTAPRGWLSS
jgi:hypothetical protein